MKQIIIALLMIISANAFSQKNPPSDQLSREYYLEKRKGNNSAGWIMIGTGLLAVVIGSSLGIHEPDPAAEIIPVVGLGLIACSIPLFISAGENKRRAASLSFETQPVFLPKQNRSMLNGSPGLTIKIGI